MSPELSEAIRAAVATEVGVRADDVMAAVCAAWAALGYEETDPKRDFRTAASLAAGVLAAEEAQGRGGARRALLRLVEDT